MLNTYPCIIIIENNYIMQSFRAANVSTLNFSNLNEYIINNSLQVNPKYLKDNGWNLTDENNQEVLDNIKSIGKPLSEYLDGEIFRGIITGYNKAFVVTKGIKEKLIEEDPNCRKLIKPFGAKE